MAAIIVTHSETTQRKYVSMVLYVCTSIVLTMTRSFTVSPASELDMVFSIRTVYSSRYIHVHTTKRSMKEYIPYFCRYVTLRNREQFSFLTQAGATYLASNGSSVIEKKDPAFAKKDRQTC